MECHNCPVSPYLRDNNYVFIKSVEIDTVGYTVTSLFILVWFVKVILVYEFMKNVTTQTPRQKRIPTLLNFVERVVK